MSHPNVAHFRSWCGTSEFSMYFMVLSEKVQKISFEKVLKKLGKRCDLKTMVVIVITVNMGCRSLKKKVGKIIYLKSYSSFLNKTKKL